VSFNRHQINPPDEAFEATWRDAQAILETAGPESGFVLLVARDLGDNYGTRFALSTGRDKIPRAALQQLVNNWFNEERGYSDEQD
jgi:hypothetical protein